MLDAFSLWAQRCGTASPHISHTVLRSCLLFPAPQQGVKEPQHGGLGRDLQGHRMTAQLGCRGSGTTQSWGMVGLWGTLRVTEPRDPSAAVLKGHAAPSSNPAVISVSFPPSTSQIHPDHHEQPAPQPGCRDYAAVRSPELSPHHLLTAGEIQTKQRRRRSRTLDDLARLRAGASERQQVLCRHPGLPKGLCSTTAVPTPGGLTHSSGSCCHK